MYKMVGASFVVLVGFALAAAEEITGIVTKVDGDKVTFRKFGGGKKGGGKAEETTLPLAANAKFMKAKRNKEDKKIETDGDLEGGKEAFVKRVKDAAEAAKKNTDDTKKKKFGFGAGVFTQLATEGEGDAAKITEVRVLPAFGGFKKKKDAN